MNNNKDNFNQTYFLLSVGLKFKGLIDGCKITSEMNL